MRQLAEEGYLRTHRETILSEMLHGLGPKGKVIVEGKGLDCVGSTEVPRQIAHFTGINDVRIAVETGIVPVAYFFANWQFAPVGWRHPVVPDAIFALRAPALRNFVVEFDRATEGLSTLAAKLRVYQESLPGFSFEAVLIITERERVLDSLKREAGKRNISLRVLVGTLAELQSKGIEECSFFELASGGRLKLLDPRLQSGES